MANGTTDALENPARSEVTKVSVPVRANSYPAKCMALAKAIRKTDCALGLHDACWYFSKDDWMDAAMFLSPFAYNISI